MFEDESNSVVCTVTSLQGEQETNRGSIPGRDTRPFSLQNLQIGYGSTHCVNERVQMAQDPGSKA
jgi:hypothetical protein